MARQPENPESERAELALVELLYGELEDPAQQAQIEADPAFKEQLEAWARVRKAADALPELEPELSTHYALLKAAREAVAPAPRGFLASFIERLGFAPALAALGMLAAAIGTLSLLNQEEQSFEAAPQVTAPSGAMPAPKDELTKVEEKAPTATVVVGPAPAAVAGDAPLELAEPEYKGKTADKLGKLGGVGSKAEAAPAKPTSKAAGPQGDVSVGRARREAPGGGEASRPEPQPSNAIKDERDGPSKKSEAAALAGLVEDAKADPAAEPSPAQTRYAPPPPARPAVAETGGAAGLDDALLGEVQSAPPAPKAARAPAEERAADEDAEGTEARRSTGELLTQARSAQQKGDHQLALVLFDEYRRSQPAGATLNQALLDMARSYEAVGRVAQAVNLYRLLAKEPGAIGDAARARLERLSPASSSSGKPE